MDKEKNTKAVSEENIYCLNGRVPVKKGDSVRTTACSGNIRNWRHDKKCRQFFFSVEVTSSRSLFIIFDQLGSICCIEHWNQCSSVLELLHFFW